MHELARWGIPLALAVGAGWSALLAWALVAGALIGVATSALVDALRADLT